MLPSVLSANLSVTGIDFSKSESIAIILEGVNKIRGAQDVTLILDETRKLKIMEASKFEFCALTVTIKKNDVIMYNNTVKMSWKEFIVGLKELTKLAKMNGNNEFPLMLHFDSDITGVEGHQKLKDLYDHGVFLIFSREENREERNLRLEESKRKKPASPKANKMLGSDSK